MKPAKFCWLSLLLLVQIVPAASGQQFDLQSGLSMTPSEMHQIMARQKAEALERARGAAALEAIEIASTQTNHDVQFYDVFIRVDDTTEILYGSVRCVALAVDDPVSQVEVDLYSNMAIDSVTYPGGVLGYSRSGNVVTVTLDRAYNQGEQFEFTTYYYGHPVEGGFQAFAFDYYLGEPIISSLSEPYFARTWWPCKDRMDDKADSFYIAIEVDTSLWVGSNGLPDSTIVGGTNSHTFYYSTRYPMVTYLFSVAIHPYTVWTDEYIYNAGADTMPLVHAVYPYYYTTSLTGWGVTPQVLTVLSDHFGQYPFVDEKYGHSNFQWGGAMEHQTMTSMAGSSFGFWEPVVIHEAAHQWWGDMITCESWSDIWLNEGWASYSEALYYLTTSGWASYHSYMNGMRYTGDGTIYVYDTTSVGMIFHGGRSYDKGAWVCHMLRGVLGDSLFYEGVDAYYDSEFKWKAATTQDFKIVFEEATDTDLDWFIDEWIFGTYFPDYRFEYTSRWVDIGVSETYLFVEQVQLTDPMVYTMPVDFFVDYSTVADDTMTFFVDQREQLFKFTAPSPVTSIELDPSDWILKVATERPWQMHIITLDGELPDGVQGEPYSSRIVALGGSGVNTVSIVAGALPSGYVINDVGVISGTTVDTGSFVFTVLFDDDNSSLADQGQFTLNVLSMSLVPGDVAFDDGFVDIGDLTYLISFMFISGPPLPVPNLADVNADCTIDIGDVTDLIGYLFIEGPVPLMGCVD
ncbi:MAG: hypothetical protein JSU65_01990 [Candidatus Zixiibacteriota bacterium]|nr:MAG: hypothetical protein JSU65_01990 [candidate division Zixibacteria bacterium]